MKKCQQSVNDHKAYANKYAEVNDWLSRAEDKMKKSLESISSANSQTEWNNNLSNLKQLLDARPSAVSLVNAAVELGEKLYSTMSVEGREIVRNQLEDAQNRMETMFDRLTETERDLQSKLSRYVHSLQTEL